MVFAPVEATPDLPRLEKELLERWNQEQLFKKSLEKRVGQPLWIFYEGPPTANGTPGIHHVWARVFKDLYPRFWSMRGRYVPRIGGWDCHGLPVEIEVERELGFSAKAQIEEYGIEAFNQKCAESVQRYVHEWTYLTERIGMWIDTENAYWTMSNEFIESVWWIFSQLWEKGLIYEGSKVVPYCGRCGTALSSHEVAQGYEDITEDSVYVRFSLEDKPYDLLAWTTTPWTLISNVALGVGGGIQYVEVKCEGARNLVLAKDRIEAVLGEAPNVVRELDTSELVGAIYEPPFDYLRPTEEGAYRVLEADFVSTDEGSGIVHMASSFGEVDRQVCEANGVPSLNPVNAEGKFDESVGPHSGNFVIDTNPKLIAELGDAVFKVESYSHSYPHCWRCDTPLIYWAKPTWFARTSQKRSELLLENSKIGWHPAHIKEGRFGTWLEENVDWALSRDRFWGTPIPLWRCDECGDLTCVESLKALVDLSNRDLSDMNLHKPFIDEVNFACSTKTCSGTFRREPSVLDAWFDSGSMPLAQFHYPFANEDHKETFFPADFICEAIDQTRGWFYSLLAVNTLTYGETPYKNVVCLAHILDKDGTKMSKSRGNTIDPLPPIEELGADGVRWYFLSEGSPWTPRRMSLDEVARSTRQTLMTLWNVYAFFVTYANIDGWQPGDEDPSKASQSLDLWLRSRLASTIQQATTALEDFDAFRAAKAIQTFVDDMSNWYVRRSRSRFWSGEDPMGHAVLFESLVSVAQLLAPFCPFLSDAIYRNLMADTSVHLSDWPDPESKNAPIQNLSLEKEVEIVRKLAALGRSARFEAGIKVRKPLGKALIVFPSSFLNNPTDDSTDSTDSTVSIVEKSSISDSALQDLADELNVKSVEVSKDLEGLFSYEARPNFKSLGPRLGEKMNKVAKHIREMDGKDLKMAFAEVGHYVLQLGEEEILLEPTDVEITATSHEDLAVAQESGFSIALDLNLTPELLAEGVVRELIRFVNEHRKNCGLEISDRISLEISAQDWIYQATQTHSVKLAKEVLATDISILEAPPKGDIVVELTEAGDQAGIKIALAGDKNAGDKNPKK